MRSLKSALAAFVSGAALWGPSLASAQAMDPTFAQHVKEWTTKPEFISPLVDHLPASATVPSPRDVLGHDIGAPNKLDYYEDILKYYRALAAKSPAGSRSSRPARPRKAARPWWC